eukprot:7050598-Pyramimonas_sp.AAC.1
MSSISHFLVCCSCADFRQARPMRNGYKRLNRKSTPTSFAVMTVLLLDLDQTIASEHVVCASVSELVSPSNPDEVVLVLMATDAGARIRG